MKARLGTVMLLVSVMLGVLAPARPALADALDDARARQAQLNAAIQADKNRLAQVQGQQAQAQAQLSLLSDQISLAEAKLATQKALYDTILGNIEKTKRDLAAKNEEQARLQEQLNRRNRALYKEKGTSNFLDAVFTARTFPELVDRFMVMRDITHSDQRLLEQVNADKAAIEALHAQQAAQADEKAKAVSTIRDQTNALLAQYTQVSILRAQLASTAITIEQQQQQAQAALLQANAEVASLAAARGRAHSSGVFAWPGVQGPITQGFGCTDLRGEPPPPPGYSCPPSARYFHAGIDIAGPYGAEIDATDGGIAYTYAGSSGYGNHVIIIHQNGFASLYGHMSGFAIGDGVGVAKGQKIGFEGSTGFSTGAHLHFEIRLNNQPVNPCKYVGC
jgi:murein DD-endopeptidase MepM/ murein hydrolase activator NlpD